MADPAEESAVCSQCIDDEYLRTIVEQEGSPGVCSECRNKSERVFTPTKLAEVLSPIIQEHYSQGEYEERFGPDDELREQVGEDLSSVIQQVLGQYFDCVEDIAEALIDNEEVRPQDGDLAFFDYTANYVEAPRYSNEWEAKWADVEEDLKARSRFFSSSAKVFFDDLFQGLEELQSWRGSESAIRTLSRGTSLFRARNCDSGSLLKEILLDPAFKVGPPPHDCARAGRMNADGIVVFYGALESETCVAEMRPPIGGDTAVIELRTTRDLRLFDFTRLRDAFRMLSYFHPNFGAEASRMNFARKVGRLVARPVVPGNEAGYLITQTMAEYLAQVHLPHFDGILFDSVQKEGGMNVVLFSRRSDDGDPAFPIEYVPNSLRIYDIKSVRYDFGERHLKLLDGQILDLEFRTDDD